MSQTMMWPENRPPGSVQDGLDLGRILGAFRRRMVLFFGTVVVVTAFAILVTSQLEPRYVATAAMLIDPQEVRVLDTRAVADGVQGGEADNDTTLATQVSILTSRSHAAGVVDDLQLVTKDEFRPPVAWWRSGIIGRLYLQASSLGGALLADVGEWAAVLGGNDSAQFDGLPPTGSAVADAPTNPPLDEVAFATDHLLDNLTVYRDGGSQAIIVRFTAAEPRLAAAVANAVIDNYMRGQMEDKVAETAAAASWIAGRAAELGGELRAAEHELERFRAANDLQEGSGGSLDSRQLASVHEQLLEARTDRAASEARLQRIGEIRETSGNFQSIDEIASSPLITNLRQQDADLGREEAQLAREYGRQHPRMIEIRSERAQLSRKIRDEIEVILEGIADRAAQATVREQAIEASLAAAKTRSAEAEQASVELRELERDVTARRSVYEMMLVRSQEIDQQRDLLRADARVISHAAIPEKPGFPRPGLFAAIGIIGSLGIGVVLVAIAELIDRTLRSERQIEQVLGLRTLTMVPKVRKVRRGATPTRYVLEQPGSAYAEALRQIETREKRAGSSPSRARLVLVTSSLPGEGKTTLATSLALSAARVGRRTILVDLDLRRPSVEMALGLPNSNGVAAFLLNARPWQDMVRVPPCQRHLDVLGNTGGVIRNHELARSAKLPQLIAELRRAYDLIVVDTAPVLGLADTKILTSLADQVLFVVHWEATHEGAARSAIEALRSVEAPIAGAVLSQVDLRRHARYGYADAGSYFNRYATYYND